MTSLGDFVVLIDEKPHPEFKRENADLSIEKEITLVEVYAYEEDVYPGYEGMHIRGTRVCISGVRGYAYPGYEGMHIRGTRVCISGARGYAYPGYEGMHIRGGKSGQEN